MGKAFYRAYRPKSLEEVVGQEHITTTLKNALKSGNISHAYLFTGPRGVGKTSVARILAHEVNQLTYDEEATNLDIIEIDAASNRRIDEIRELRDKVHIAPTSAKYKVYIIDEVHMLTREAFNALLKTLEEPPEHAIFILATTELHKVPETIISRTQRYNFKPISENQSIEHLRNIAKKENLTVNDEALKLISEHGKGSFRDSISILDQLVSFSDNKITVDSVRSMLGIPSDELINKIINDTQSNDIKSIFTDIQDLTSLGISSGTAAKSISKILRQMLLDKSTKLPNDRVIQILKNLLEITNSTNDYTGLELALVDSIEFDQTSQLTKTANPRRENKDVEKVDRLENVQTEVEKSQNTIEENSAIENEELDNKQSEITDIDEKWQKMLNDIKGNHNTFYGLLRMSKPEFTNGKLTLNFKFGFHKKQVENPQNSTLLKNYIKTHYGINTFDTKLNKQEKTKTLPTITPQKPVNSDDIKTVSNIFGGAELLE